MGIVHLELPQNFDKMNNADNVNVSSNINSSLHGELSLIMQNFDKIGYGGNGTYNSIK